MPLLKSPKAGVITSETVFTMRRITDDQRIAEDATAVARLLKQRDGILLTIQQRKVAACDEQEAARRELRSLFPTATTDDDWQPDLSHDAMLLTLQAQLAAVEQDLLTRKRRIDAVAPDIHREALQAGAAVQLQDLQKIVELLREARAVARLTQQHGQQLYGLVHDFLVPIRLVTALATYPLEAWEAELTRLQRIVEGT